MRGSVLDNPDGSIRIVADDSVFAQVQRAMRRERRHYERIRVPALAIYAQDWLASAGYPDSTQEKVRRWAEGYYRPFKAAQVARVRSELKGVEVIEMPGTHMDFILTSHHRVVAELRRFLVN